MIFRALMTGLLIAALSAPPVLAQGSLPDVEPRPVRPPMPSYPVGAARVMLQGYCEVEFSVDTRGRTSNIHPRCSHPEFCASATAAMEEVRFMPGRRDGRIVQRNNIVYPLEYRIEGMPDSIPDRTELKGCVDPLVS